MIIEDGNLATVRLFQLISPTLPTGAFTYSQGLEWAVEQGWVHDMDTTQRWLSSLLHCAMAALEIPLFMRLYKAAAERDLEGLNHWTVFLVASRETRELRKEEMSRGQAMARLLAAFELESDSSWLEMVRMSQMAGFAIAAANWRIACDTAALGYIWGWLENMVMAAVKLVPLGQSEGQRILLNLHPSCVTAVERGGALEDDELTGSCPAFSLASCRHETQYTRLFRS